jgi:hypothetical protein
MNHDLLSALQESLEAFTGRSDLDRVSSLAAMGIDSLESIEWVYLMEDKFEVSLTEDETFFEVLGQMSITELSERLGEEIARVSRSASGT